MTHFLYTTQNPTTSTSTPGASYGSDVFIGSPGRILGMRFYRGSGATITSRTMRIWDAAGVQLGSVTTSGETGTGWQPVVSLASAITINTPQMVRLSLDHSVNNLARMAAQNIQNGALLSSDHYGGGTVGQMPVTIVSYLYFLDIQFEPSDTGPVVPTTGQLWPRGNW